MTTVPPPDYYRVELVTADGEKRYTVAACGFTEAEMLQRAREDVVHFCDERRALQVLSATKITDAEAMNLGQQLLADRARAQQSKSD